MLVGGLVGFGVYKMSTRDADRIEEHTGIPPEELEDEDLETAMDELAGTGRGSGGGRGLLQDQDAVSRRRGRLGHAGSVDACTYDDQVEVGGPHSR